MVVRPARIVGITLIGLLNANISFGQARLIPLETEDAYIYMDGEGVALRAEKEWYCRRVGPDDESNIEVFNKAGYEDFRRRQLEANEWNRWACSVRVGPVSFSREVLEAQRRMNMAPDKSDCTPWVPESGRLNWEALDYARCYVKKEVEAARLDFSARKAAALSNLIGNSTSDFNAIIAISKVTKLHRTVEGCGKTLVYIHDYVACRMEGEDALLTKAEEYYRYYSERIDAHRGRDPIPQMEASAIGEDSKLIRRTLRRARREADGL